MLILAEARVPAGSQALEVRVQVEAQERVQVWAEAQGQAEVEVGVDTAAAVRLRAADSIGNTVGYNTAYYTGCIAAAEAGDSRRRYRIPP